MNLSEYSNFDLDIIKVENIETLSTGMIRTRYTIKISLNNSNDTKIVEVFSLGSTGWNGIWNRCIDPVLSEKEKKEFIAEMQKRATACTAEDVLKVDETGLFNYRGNVIFVFGDKLLGDLPENVTAEISEDLINNFHMVPMELTEEEELRELDQILSSGGWEIHIMVYTSFLGALKPFFAEAGYPINIITNLYGHTGAKKNSLRTFVIYIF